MNTQERVRKALPMATLFVMLHQDLIANKATEVDEPNNRFRTPEESENFDRLVLEYQKEVFRLQNEERNLREKINRMNQRNDDDQPRTLKQLLGGCEDEAPIQVVVKIKNIDYVVYSASGSQLAYRETAY